MKDLDETIKDFEKAAEETEKDARFYSVSRPDKERKEYSIKKANANRQLSEWLKDYKRLLKQESVLDKIRVDIDLETRVQVKHYTNTDAIIDAVLDVIDKYKVKKEVL